MSSQDTAGPQAGAVSVVLAGIGGMGAVYVKALLESAARGDCSITGTVDPDPERCPDLDKLLALKVPVFRTLDEFYARHEAELAIISSPIQFHCEQTRLALERGSFVLCEKPPAGTVQEVRRMIAARDAARKWVAVGYQWSFSDAVQSLKKDILEGALGRPRRLRCLYLWPRDEAYYHRNDWAGKKRDPRGGWILDSPANNAMAHDLHNMFYVLGGTRETGALPVRVQAELYRANDIENFDTIALRCQTEDGVEILFYASHAADLDTGPVFSYEFEKGAVSVRGRDTAIRADFWNGEGFVYGFPDAERMKKLRDVIGAVRGGRPPACGLEAALGQTLCLNGAQDSMPRITDFPEDMMAVRGEPGQRFISVTGLAESLTECYESSLLPSEMDMPWSRKGELIDIARYGDFPLAP
jgi:predicted dehydrogenase